MYFPFMVVELVLCLKIGLVSLSQKMDFFFFFLEDDFLKDSESSVPNRLSAIWGG